MLRAANAPALRGTGFYVCTDDRWLTPLSHILRCACYLTTAPQCPHFANAAVWRAALVQGLASVLLECPCLRLCHSSNRNTQDLPSNQASLDSCCQLSRLHQIVELLVHILGAPHNLHAPTRLCERLSSGSDWGQHILTAAAHVRSTASLHKTHRAMC